MSLQIICPSTKRASEVLTSKFVANLIICCPNIEVSDYKKHNPNVEVLGVPDNVKGIVSTRQWILDNFEEPFMIDDDVKGLYKFEGEKCELDKTKGLIDALIQNMYKICSSAGIYMYGFGNHTRPQTFNRLEPFSSKTYICGSFCGFTKNHNLSYDINYPEAEDYYISLLCLYKHRKLFIDQRFRPNTVGNFQRQGGCQTYRTNANMETSTRMLIRDFGDCVKIKKPRGSKKNLASSWERTISCSL